MNFTRWFITCGMRLGLHILCRIDAPSFDQIPAQGPLILISNHTGSIEAPILYGELFPRPVSAWAKVESWNNWFLNFIFRVWEIIPIHRGEADVAALRSALRAIKRGDIFALAPEGTRNLTGRLISAKPGVATLAMLSGAPVLPVANWGGESFRANLKRFKRTDFHIRVGETLKVETKGLKVTNAVRQEIADEIMYSLAALLPGEYRGAYSDLDKASRKYLIPVSRSRRARE